MSKLNNIIETILRDKIKIFFCKIEKKYNIDQNELYNLLNKMDNSNINTVKVNGNIWIDKMLKDKLTYTKPGSISHLIHGKKPSEQSINIKLGHFGEYLSKELIKINNNIELLPCGIQEICNKKKDVDLIFKNKNSKLIYYLELKGNIELDTEKLQATIDKCKQIEKSLKLKYNDYGIKIGILNWSVYNRMLLTNGLSKIKTFENAGINIYHMNDFLEIINVIWDEHDFYSYFKNIGDKIKYQYE